MLTHLLALLKNLLYNKVQTFLPHKNISFSIKWNVF